MVIIGLVIACLFTAFMRDFLLNKKRRELERTGITSTTSNAKRNSERIFDASKANTTS